MPEEAQRHRRAGPSLVAGPKRASGMASKTKSGPASSPSASEAVCFRRRLPQGGLDEQTSARASTGRRRSRPSPTRAESSVPAGLHGTPAPSMATSRRIRSSKSGSGPVSSLFALRTLRQPPCAPRTERCAPTSAGGLRIQASEYSTRPDTTASMSSSWRQIPARSEGDRRIAQHRLQGRHGSRDGLCRVEHRGLTPLGQPRMAERARLGPRHSPDRRALLQHT